MKYEMRRAGHPHPNIASLVYREVGNSLANWSEGFYFVKS